MIGKSLAAGFGVATAASASPLSGCGQA